MSFLLFAFIILSLFSIKHVGDNSEDALSKEQRQTIKGMFVLTIFFSLFCSYVVLKDLHDSLLSDYCRYLGQLMVVLGLVYIVLVSRFKPSYWFDTILAFPFGCFVSLYKEKIMRFGSRRFLWTCLCLFCVLIFVFAQNNEFLNSFINAQIALVCFMSLIVLFSMKVKFRNKIFSWLGSQVFGVYILQRLSMNFGQLLSVVFHKVTDRIDLKFFRAK